MVEKTLYKIIALIAAFFIYLFFIYSFIEFVKDSEKEVKDYGYNVEDAIVVELESLPDKAPVVKKPDPTPKPIEKPKPIIEVQPEVTPPIEEVKPEPIVEPEPEPEPEPVPELTKPEPEPIKEIVAQEVKEKAQESRDLEAKSAKDLFSTIRVKNYDKVIEERQKEDSARASRLAKQKAAKQKKAKEKKAKAKALMAAKALMKDIQTSTTSSHKKRGEKDDFWSPVSSKIMAKWNRTISTQDGLMATVKIRIDKTGKLSFRIKRLSNNSLFDTKLKIFLENLEYERFPKYRGGAFIEANFEFKDQSESY